MNLSIQAARRGRARYEEITDRLRECAATHGAPVRVWIDRATADDFMALWFAVSHFDGVLPQTICGIPCEVGSTGGHSFVFEFIDNPEKRAAIVSAELDRIAGA